MLRSWQVKATRVTVYLSSCIVTKPPPLDRRIRRALVNSANEALAGTQLPYFPMLKTPPKGLTSTSWGGMDAGSGMFYRTQVVDGIVSQVGGAKLRKILDALPEVAPGIKCPLGRAVVTTAPGLADHYDIIVHTASPLFSAQMEEHDSHFEGLLLSCYEQTLHAGFGAGARVISLPLIGAGARFAPVQLACRLAARAAVSEACRVIESHVSRDIIENEKIPKEIQFVLLEHRVGTRLVEEIEGLLQSKGAGN